MDCNAQGSPEAKKPCKGILKTSSSFDKHSVSQRRKSTKFDEINVMQTYHPPDKDYGHMKVEEPKTPYNYANPDDQLCDQVDADVLAERLKMSEPRKSLDDTGDDESSDDDERSFETPEEKQRRLEFEKRRKLHYNEFEALKLARKLMEEDEEDDDGAASAAAKVKAFANQTREDVDEQSQEASASADNDDDERENTGNEVEMDNDNS